MDPYFWKRLWRKPWLSLCSLILSAVLCMLLCFLVGYRQEQRAILEETQANFEILCVVSNVKGTQTMRLQLGSWAEHFVTSEDSPLRPYIKDLRMTKEFTVSSAALGLSDARLTGVTNERCADSLDPRMGGSVTLRDSAFYESAEPLLLVSEAVYDRLNGETEAELTVTDPATARFWAPDVGVGKFTFRVAGYYKGTGEELFISFPAAQALSFDLSGQTHVDSIAFLAADNAKLDELAAAAAEKFKTVDPLSTDNGMLYAALTIHDEQYREAVTALEQSIARSGYFLPALLLLSLGVGFLVSLLATRSERRTYALMRTLGVPKGKLFFSILREQLFLPALAAMLAAVVFGKPAPALVYLLCHTVGCCIAVLRSVRIAPTAILREQE